jgi:hypothetical protein
MAGARPPRYDEYPPRKRASAGERAAVSKKK